MSGQTVLEIGVARVELLPIGFVVTVDDRPFPKTLPNQLPVWASKSHARSFAKALNLDDTDACHELIARGCRFYAWASGGVS